MMQVILVSLWPLYGLFILSFGLQKVSPLQPLKRDSPPSWDDLAHEHLGFHRFNVCGTMVEPGWTCSVLTLAKDIYRPLCKVRR